MKRAQQQKPPKRQTQVLQSEFPMPKQRVKLPPIKQQLPTTLSPSQSGFFSQTQHKDAVIYIHIGGLVREFTVDRHNIDTLITWKGQRLTALQVTIIENSKIAFHTLLKMGANPNTISGNGKTAIEIAKELGMTEFIEKMLQIIAKNPRLSHDTYSDPPQPS